MDLSLHSKRPTSKELLRWIKKRCELLISGCQLFVAQQLKEDLPNKSTSSRSYLPTALDDHLLPELENEPTPNPFEYEGEDEDIPARYYAHYV